MWWARAVLSPAEVKALSPCTAMLHKTAKPILRAYVRTDTELAKVLADLIEIRTQLKAINSSRAISMLLCELDTLSAGRREDKLRLVRQSIANSWKSVFPLKGQGVARPAAPLEVTYGVR
ncbi:MAG: hypothetical protein VB071_07350 [Lawsonibacter sp.]|nr:hypothetical protein [Lawsonibacter sp.]